MKNRIAFWGDSLTEGGKWERYFPDDETANFGISGQKSVEIISRLDEVLAWNPSKIFLMMGINDLGHGLNFKTPLENYKIAIDNVKELKNTDLFVQSLLPTNKTMFQSSCFEGENILELNSHVKDLCEKEKITFVDLYTAFSTNTYQLIRDYTTDGLHLNEAGYSVWKNCLQSENLI